MTIPKLSGLTAPLGPFKVKNGKRGTVCHTLT